MASGYNLRMTIPVHLQPDDPVFVRALAHLAPAPRATLLAMMVGFVAMCAMAPLAILPPFVFATLLIGVPMGLILPLPVTFVVLPLCALVCGRYRRVRTIALPLTGLIAGALVPRLVFAGSHPGWRGLMMFVIAGAVAGLAAGVYFIRKTAKLYGAQPRVA
jgi:hypothetical protein